MSEATWGDTADISDWRMSAALENVPRGDSQLVEVTSLEGAVRAWLELDSGHQDDAVIRPEHPVLLDGVSHDRFACDGIAELASMLTLSRPIAANAP